MPGLLGLSTVSFTQVNAQRSSAYLAARNAQGILDRDSLSNALRFQWFPESVSDTKQDNNQQKEIPGGSLPLYQWIAGGERLISFTAVFSSDVDFFNADSAATTSGPQDLFERNRNASEGANVDVRTALLWLRQFKFPTYGQSQSANGGAVTLPPRTLQLVLPGSKIGLLGGWNPALHGEDDVACKMLQCDITYKSFFPSGTLRFAEVQLSFAEICQNGDQVVFPGWSPVLDNYIAQGTSSSYGVNRLLPYTLRPRVLAGGIPA